MTGSACRARQTQTHTAGQSRGQMQGHIQTIADVPVAYVVPWVVLRSGWWVLPSCLGTSRSSRLHPDPGQQACLQAGVQRFWATFIVSHTAFAGCAHIGDRGEHTRLPPGPASSPPCLPPKLQAGAVGRTMADPQFLYLVIVSKPVKAAQLQSQCAGVTLGCCEGEELASSDPCKCM